jgi:hypothetical protein
MNIFYLHRDVWQCAKMHCDVHVNKMILESAQLLSTAHHELGSTAPYKTTHKNHPSAVWARSGRYQYQWLYRLLEALSDEYTFRYGKVHLTWERCSEALSEPPRGIADISSLNRLSVCLMSARMTTLKSPIVIITHKKTLTGLRQVAQ